jgi:predicted protein tyrosine phosphatase
MIKTIYAAPRITIYQALHSASARGSGRNVLISINTYPDAMLITEAGHVKRLIELGYIDHLSLAFGDITAEALFSHRINGDMEAPGVSLFSYDDARAIRAFIDKWKYEEIDRLVVHCDKGQSRSGAVALWAQRYCAMEAMSGFVETQFWTANRAISPNRYIGRVLFEISGMPFNEKEF